MIRRIKILEADRTADSDAGCDNANDSGFWETRHISLRQREYSVVVIHLCSCSCKSTEAEG
jgi:hypothetical protein